VGTPGAGLPCLCAGSDPRARGAGAGLPLALSQTRAPRGDTRCWVCPAYVLGLTRTHGWKPWRDPRLMGPTSGPSSLGSCVRTQYYWVLQHDSVLLGSVLGPKANGSCVRTRTQTHPPWVQPQTQTQPSWVQPRTPPTWSEHRPNPLGSGHGPKPLRSTPGRT